MRQVEYKGLVYMFKNASWVGMNGEMPNESESEQIYDAYLLKCKEEERENSLCRPLDALLEDGENIISEIYEYNRRMLRANHAQLDDYYLRLNAVRGAAIFETAICKIIADTNLDNRTELLRSSLPKLSSCYRNTPFQQNCIEMYKRAMEECPEAINHELLTSLTAAYLDIKDYKSAVQTFYDAVVKCNYRPTAPLKRVALRLAREISGAAAGNQTDENCYKDFFTTIKTLRIID